MKYQKVLGLVKAVLKHYWIPISHSDIFLREAVITSQQYPFSETEFLVSDEIPASRSLASNSLRC